MDINGVELSCKKASTNHNAKLTVEQIMSIFALEQKRQELRLELSKHSHKEIAKRFNVTKDTISKLLNGSRYKHIKRPK